MAATFVSTITRTYIKGDRRYAEGTFTAAGGSTGGDIATGLTRTEGLIPTATGAAVAADDCTVNEAFPITGGAVTIVVTANTTGNWIAWGI